MHLDVSLRYFLTFFVELVSLSFRPSYSFWTIYLTTQISLIFVFSSELMVASHFYLS